MQISQKYEFLCQKYLLQFFDDFCHKIQMFEKSEFFLENNIHKYLKNRCNLNFNAKFDNLP